MLVRMSSDTRHPAPPTLPASTPDGPGLVELDLDQLREVTGGLIIPAMHDDPHGAFDDGYVSVVP